MERLKSAQSQENLAKKRLMDAEDLLEEEELLNQTYLSWMKKLPL